MGSYLTAITEYLIQKEYFNQDDGDHHDDGDGDDGDDHMARSLRTIQSGFEKEDQEYTFSIRKMFTEFRKNNPVALQGRSGATCQCTGYAYVLKQIEAQKQEEARKIKEAEDKIQAEKDRKQAEKEAKDKAAFQKQVIVIIVVLLLVAVLVF